MRGHTPEIPREIPRRRVDPNAWATLLFLPLMAAAAGLPCAALHGQESAAVAIPASSVRALSGHTETAYDVTFSPRGDLVASASFDRSIKVWKTSDGSLVGTLEGHEGKVLAITFSPDGGTILSGSEDKTLRLWTVPGAGPDVIGGHSGRVDALAVSPDERWLATASADGTVVVREHGSRKKAFTLKGSGPRSVGFATDGSLVAGGFANGTLRVWALPVPKPATVASAAGADVALVPAGQPWRFHKGTEAPPADWAKPGFDDSKWETGNSGFGYSSNAEELQTVGTRLDDMPQRQYLSLFIRKTFRVDDVKRVEKLSLRMLFDDAFVAYLNGVEVGREKIEGSPPAHNAAAVAAGEPTETVVDLTPHLGQLKDGDNVLAIQGHNASTSSSDFVLTPVLSASLRAQEKKEEKKPGPGAEVLVAGELGGPVTAVAIAPGGAAVACVSRPGEVHVHAISGDGGKRTVKVGEGAVGGVAFLDDATIIAARADGSLRVFEIESGKESKAMAGHEGAVRSLAVAPGGKVAASGGEDRSVRIWNVAEGKEARKLDGHEAAVVSVAFSADGQTLVSGAADGSVRVWNALDGSPITAFKQGGATTSVGVSRDGKYYSAGQGNDVIVWRVATPGAVKSLTGHGALVHAVALSRDSQRAASGSADKTVRIWNVADGKQLHSINAHDGSVYCVAFSPDGATVASGGYDKTIKLWNAADGKEIKKLEGHEEGIFALTFSADGKTLVSASSDRTVRIWEVDSGTSTRVLSGHPGWVMDVHLLPDGGAVSADYGGHVFLWSLESGEATRRWRVDGTVHGFAASADGAKLATANSNGTVFLINRPE